MKNFKKLINKIIEQETKFLTELNESDSTNFEVGLNKSIKEMKEEVKSCKCINDLVSWYCDSGFKLDEAYENIIDAMDTLIIK